MPTEKVNVTIADQDPGQFSEVVRRLEEAGLQIEQSLPEIGIVSGSIDSAKKADLDQLHGVAGVESDRVIRIPPPDSPVQ
jgi:hypothetical protein